MKKVLTVLYLSSLPLIVLGTALVVLTPRIMEFLPGFLEDHVFHRTFDHAAYEQSMRSLILIPFFLALALDALCFVRLSDGKKVVLVLSYLASTAFCIGYLSYSCARTFVGQDMSSEMLFASECFRARTFWPTQWYYSMEFRLLNTQLITAPLFFLTDDLSLLRSLTALLSDAVLFGGTWFLLKRLRVRAPWLRLLCCTLMVSPLSWTFLNEVQVGNYYVPHIVFSFCYVGLFVSLAFHSDSASPRVRRRRMVLFSVLALVSGASTIRYILNFTFPAFAVVALRLLRDAERDASAASLPKLGNDRLFRLSGGGLLLSCAGYAFNSTVLASVYTFKNMNKIQFNPLDAMRLDRIKDMFLRVAGYNEDVSVFTPGGTANILLLAVIVLSALCARDMWRNDREPYRRFFLAFSAFFSAFHLYTNVMTEMVGRYLAMVIVFFVPFLALVVESSVVPPFRKWLLAASASVLFLTNAQLAFSKMSTGSTSMELEGVCSFLEENGYEFGYAFSSLANPIWFWSNGRIEVAAIDDEELDDVDVLPGHFAIHRWLEPKRFEREEYCRGGSRVFFAVGQEEYERSLPSRVLERGRVVYQDRLYLVLDYEDAPAFISSFGRD